MYIALCLCELILEENNQLKPSAVRTRASRAYYRLAKTIAINLHVQNGIIKKSKLLVKTNLSWFDRDTYSHCKCKNMLESIQ